MRKDSILQNYYYSKLPKAKEGGNYFNKYKVPQSTTTVKKIDPILKFSGGGDYEKFPHLKDIKNTDKTYKSLPSVTVYGSPSKKKKETDKKNNEETLKNVTVTTPKKKVTIAPFTPSVSSDFFRNKKTTTPEQQFNAYSNFADNNAGYDMSAPVTKTNVPSAYSEQQFRDMPLINTGRKALNSQAQAAAMMQLINMSNGIANNYDAYINMLEQTDPERAALLRFMNPNAFKQPQFFNGGFLMPAQKGGNINFPSEMGYRAPRMNNGGGLLSRTVKCSSCGHSWKAVDGGEDVMTCHKCGGMIKMQNGGITKYGPGGQTTDGCPAGYSKHPLTKECMPNGTALSQVLSQVIANSNKQKPSEYIRPNNVTDVMGRTPLQTLIDNQIGQEIVNKNIATNKRQFLNQGQATTKESEARRKRLTKQSVAGLPNVAYDQQTGTTSAVNPNMTYEGQPANFMGERQQKSVDHIMGALEAAGYITGVGELAGLGYRGLKTAIGNSIESGLLSKAHNINPFAFKPQEGMMYRGLGQEGMEDAIRSGVFRPKQLGYAPNRSLAEKVATPKQFENTFYAPAEEFGVVKGYGPNYLAEVPFKGNQFGRRYGRKNWSWSTPKQIPIDEGNILKKDWLQGYKKVPTSTKVGSSIENVKPTFKSEIDWGGWNSEIPANEALMNEYNAIEQTSKANGSWMKNPDGSAFQGTPEQFVQQNSENFKKAFPNVVKNELGNVQLNYHGSPNTFEEFLRMYETSDFTGKSFGEGIYTTPNKKLAESYITARNPDRDNTGKLYELYVNANKKQDKVYNIQKYIDNKIEKLKQDLKSGKITKEEKNTIFNDIMKEDTKLWDNISDEDFKLKNGYDYLRVNDEQVIPFTNYPKSAISNNGMFDMTNSNIYKSMLPYMGIGAVGTAVLNKKKQGGLVKAKVGNEVKCKPGQIYLEGTGCIDIASPMYKELYESGKLVQQLPDGKVVFPTMKPFVVNSKLTEDQKRALLRRDMQETSAQNQTSIGPAAEQPWYERAFDIATHPGTAIRAYNKKGYIPSNLGAASDAMGGSQSVINTLSPATWLKGAYNAGKQFGSAPIQTTKDVVQGIGNLLGYAANSANRATLLPGQSMSEYKSPFGDSGTNARALEFAGNVGEALPLLEFAPLIKGALKTGLGNSKKSRIFSNTNTVNSNNGNWLNTQAQGTVELATNANNTIQREAQNIMKDLMSAEGANRLRGQFKIAMPNATEEQLDHLVGNRLMEVNTSMTNNKARFYLRHGEGGYGTPSFGRERNFFPHKNAHFDSSPNLFPEVVREQAPASLNFNSIYPQNLASKDIKVSGVGSFASPDYRPGSITLGAGYEFNPLVVRHEAHGHALQGPGYNNVLPLEHDLLDLAKPKSLRDKAWFKLKKLKDPSFKGNYDYFTKGEGSFSESFPFLVENRELMKQRGIIRNTYDKVGVNELLSNREMGKNLRIKNSNDRFLQMYPSWKYKKLADIWNIAPAAVIGTGAAAVIGNESSEQPTKQRFGGSWLGQYEQGGFTMNNSAPTPQTGSNSTGPMFSNQAGQNNNNDQTNTDWMIGALGLATTIGGYGLFGNKTKKMIQPQQQPLNQQQLNVDGNGKPISLNQTPTMTPSYGMARRGGDVSIYGRRNYKADTPSFFNFGGTTNNRMNINNWLNKYKS